MDNFWLGTIIVSICVGVMYGQVFGWLTLGGICLFAGIWQAADDSIVKYRNSGKGNKS